VKTGQRAKKLAGEKKKLLYGIMDCSRCGYIGVLQ